MKNTGIVLSIIGIAIYAICDLFIFKLIGGSGGDVPGGVFVTIVVISLLFVLPGVISSLKSARNARERTLALIVQAIIIIGGYFLFTLFIVLLVIFIFLLFATKGSIVIWFLLLFGINDEDDED